MAHNLSCANAKKPGCACSGCGGSLHGWPGHLDLADGSAEERASRREDAVQDWYVAVGSDEETRCKHLSAPTPQMLGHAIDAARVDLAEYLAAHPSTAERIREFGGLLNSQAFGRVKAEAVRRTARHPELAHVSEALPGHFWCSLLAALVGAADRVERVVDKIPAQARDLLEEAPPPDWGGAQELIADTAVEAVWECAAAFLLLWRPDELFLVMRILAVFICPAPGRHPEVARLCLLSLGRGILQDAATHMLRQSLTPR
ncbi:hypothetical protein Q8791_16205 [Nocardiopsis sp. CT-R113]|uniref:Uncharacterized protein n=1 Tax=Nocardiopsis codii TaxID=3065942 RepID=A0ABU7K956_9ACTN|nr:hypothetical protein [Nocardiopsis sp. CT-R113]MEE2038768.1 hypothetical protein [Nocardiopsis sp. CT-R113]